MRIAFIGGGVMAEAIIGALLAKGLAGPTDISVGEPRAERRIHLAGTYSVRAYERDIEALRDTAVVVLAIKPQDLRNAMAELEGHIQPHQLVISIVAGASLDTIVDGLGHRRVVRAMPNTPARIGHGMTVWTVTPDVDVEQRSTATAILSALGKAAFVPEEKLIDMATAVSGSGPAYVFLAMEALADAAVHVGIPRDLAWELTRQTFVGAAHLAEDSDQHPAVLRNMVTSPGGTTAAGLLCLEEGALRACFTRAVVAAHRRAQELGG